MVRLFLDPPSTLYQTLNAQFSGPYTRRVLVPRTPNTDSFPPSPAAGRHGRLDGSLLEARLLLLVGLSPWGAVKGFRNFRVWGLRLKV